MYVKQHVIEIKILHSLGGGPGGRDQTLTVKRTKNAQKSFFFYVSSSYAKILGETNFQPREFHRSGSKAKDVKEERREKKTESW